MNTAKKILGILETSVKLDEGPYGFSNDDKLTLTQLVNVYRDSDSFLCG